MNFGFNIPKFCLKDNQKTVDTGKEKVYNFYIIFKTYSLE